MSADLTTTPRSRRGLLAAAAGAAAAAVAASVARVVPATAADGDTAIVGRRNESESTTTFHSEDSWALSGTSVNSRGLNGKSEGGQGVHGESTQNAGVAGKSEAGHGVHGTSIEARGVWGESTSGPGLVGESVNGAGLEATGATGIRAASASGAALHTTAGRVRFDGISGVVVIPPGETEVALQPEVGVDRNTFVLLTSKVDLGQKTLWYTVPSERDEIRVHISGTRSNDTPVAYLILEHAPAE